MYCAIHRYHCARAATCGSGGCCSWASTPSLAGTIDGSSLDVLGTSFCLLPVSWVGLWCPGTLQISCPGCFVDTILVAFVSFGEAAERAKCEED